MGPQGTTVRRESRHLAGRFKAAKLAPVMAVPFLGGEGGLLRQSVTFELDPVAGRMVSQTFAKVCVVYVPLQALQAMKFPADDKAGITEVIRRKLMDGVALFGLEGETEVSKRMGVVPMSIGGSKKVSVAARLAHNVAVNFLRKRRYIYASQLTSGNTVMTPAIISETVLQRLNGVLDPDDHANGHVDLSLSNTQAPVRGIGTSSAFLSNNTNLSVQNTLGQAEVFPQARDLGANGGQFFVRIKDGTTYRADVYADLSAVQAGGVSLVDFYNAQKADDLVRRMREVADANPQNGEDAVLRWAFGLMADSVQFPFMLYEKEIQLGDAQRRATDGAGMRDEVTVTDMGQVIDFTVPVPKTELGGIVVTFAQVRPDEVIAEMPHPILSKEWTAANQASAQMNLDPEPVLYRDVFADVPTAAEETAVKFYTGHNELRRNYVHYGFTRNTDLNSVNAKTVLWQYAIPAGVTPQNILYPEAFSQYPFLDQAAEVVSYTCASSAVIETQTFFGPTPVETLAIVNTKNLLED